MRSVQSLCNSLVPNAILVLKAHTIVERTIPAASSALTCTASFRQRSSEDPHTPGRWKPVREVLTTQLLLATCSNERHTLSAARLSCSQITQVSQMIALELMCHRLMYTHRSLGTRIRFVFGPSTVCSSVCCQPVNVQLPSVSGPERSGHWIRVVLRVAL